MTINTNRKYTADDIEALTALAAEAKVIDGENRELMAKVGALLEARGADFPGWQRYAEEMGLAPLVEALDVDKHCFMTANTSYIPQVGHYWSSRWNPATWQQRNKRTRRDIVNLRKAIEACEAVNV